MLNRELIGFVHEPVMMILAVRDPQGRPAIARGLGARASDDGTRLDVFVSRAQWPEVAGGCVTGAGLAVTFCRPATYRTYQIKGRVLDAGPPDAADQALARQYVADTRAVLNGLGVGDGLIDHWLVDRDLLRVGMTPLSVYDQTPGPQAGRALKDA